MAENNASYKSVDGILFNQNGTELIAYPAGKTSTSYAIPSGVTRISEYAFSCCSNLTSISIPSGVTEIGEHAFYWCNNLTNISIPFGVTEIGDAAFSTCINLTNIGIPSSVTEIGSDAFVACDSLTSIIIPSSVKKIGAYAFGYDLTYSEGEGVGYKQYENFTIVGDPGSAAETYANENGFSFVDIKTWNPENTQPSAVSKTNTNIASIDTANGTAKVTDLVAGENSEVPLAVVIEGAVYRMYNPNSGEHFYTKSSAERDSLIDSGWNYEENASFATIAADEEGAKPVYRVYNPNSGLHHYTMNHEEAIMLSNVGWNYEGIAWNVK